METNDIYASARYALDELNELARALELLAQRAKGNSPDTDIKTAAHHVQYKNNMFKHYMAALNQAIKK